MGVCLALVALTGSVWVAAIPFALFGVANAVVLIAVDTFLQQTVPEGMRGRVFSTRFMLTQGTYAVSVLVGGALAGVVDVRVLFVVAGVDRGRVRPGRPDVPRGPLLLTRRVRRPPDR